MMPSPTIALLPEPVALGITGLKVAIWLYGVLVAFHFRRPVGMLGFGIMALNTGISSLGVVTSDDIPSAVYLVSTVTAPVAAALLVYGYQTMQIKFAQCDARLRVHELAAQSGHDGPR